MSIASMRFQAAEIGPPIPFPVGGGNSAYDDAGAFTFPTPMGSPLAGSRQGSTSTLAMDRMAQQRERKQQV